MIFGRSALVILAVSGVVTSYLYQESYPGEPSSTTVYTGVPEIRDGDNVTLEGTNIRLLGVDACELGQPAVFANREIDCGIWARDRFRQLVVGSEIRCESQERGFYDRPLATCYDGQRNLNRALVDHGYAFLSRDSNYTEERNSARSANIGVWKFEQIQHPANYRDDQEQ